MKNLNLSPDEISVLSQICNECTGFCSDSRKIKKGEVFVALKGDLTDGHDFIDALLDLGIKHFVVTNDSDAKWRSKKGRFVEVQNTHLAHRELARLFRVKFKNVKILAVGGSAGKTSTKEFLFTLLESSGVKVFKTQKSQNGDLGIPITLENLGRGFDFGIVEVGIDAPGDMIRHASLLKPDAAVLTSIGEEHLNLLGTIENVFSEEKILFDETLNHGGPCFAPIADSFLNRLAGQKDIFLLDLKTPEGFLHDSLYQFLPSRVARQNAKLATFTLVSLGWVKPDLVTANLSKLQLPEGRGRIRVYGNKWVIEDHYNSNPSSLGESLKDATDFSQTHKKPLILVLGDMLDLGKSTAQMHEKIFESLKNLPTDSRFVFVGTEMANRGMKSFEPERILFSAEKLEPSVSQQIAQMLFSRKDSAIVLVKGSRGMRLEGILQAWGEFASPTQFEGR